MFIFQRDLKTLSINNIPGFKAAKALSSYRYLSSILRDRGFTNIRLLMHQSKGGSFFAFLATRKAEFKIFPYIGDGKALRTGEAWVFFLNSAGDSTVSFQKGND